MTKHPSWNFTRSQLQLFALPGWPLRRLSFQPLAGCKGEAQSTTQEAGRKSSKRKDGIGTGLSGKIRSSVEIQSAWKST